MSYVYNINGTNECITDMAVSIRCHQGGKDWDTKWGMPLRFCGCNRWHVIAIGNCIRQSFFDINIACGIHPNIQIGKKSLNIPVSINILIKPRNIGSAWSGDMRIAMSLSIVKWAGSYW